MDINELFVFAEYFEEKYMGIQHYEDAEANDSLVITSSKKKPGIANKTNPKLWARCKSEAKSRMGGKHSARAMQLALKLYKQRGGGFRGPKPTARTNKMKKWTKQKWMYLSDFKKKKDKSKAEDGANLDSNDVKLKSVKFFPKMPESKRLTLALCVLKNVSNKDQSDDVEDQIAETAWDLGFNSGKNNQSDEVEDWLAFLGNHYDVDVNEAFKEGMKCSKEPEEDENDAKGRYLPEAKWKALKPKEREATDRKKKQEGKHTQYVPNTEKAKVKSKAKYY